MIENIKKSLPQHKISSWYILVLCVIFTLITWHLLSIYSIMHRSLSYSSSIEYSIKEIFKDDEATKLINEISKENRDLKYFFDNLPRVSKNIKKASWTLMGKAELFRITGVLTFILALFAFSCRPKWVAFIALPVGLFSLFMAATII